MSNIQVRMPRDLTECLLQHLRQWQPRKPESVAFGFVTHTATPTHELVLVRGVVVPPENAFLPSQGHGARWSGKYMIELLNQAILNQYGLFIFHFHGGSRVRMSSDDLNSANELLPRFQLLIPARPHGSVVLGEDSAAGLILMPSQDRPTDEFAFRYFGSKVATYPLPEVSRREGLRFEQQPLARGTLVSRIFAETKVAIVGQSGGGTHVAQQLAQLGIGEILGIDDDHCDEGNRFAAVGIGEEDIARHRLKVDAVANNTCRIVPSVKYSPVRARVPEKEAVDALKSADIIVGCVNNLHARADIQEVALRYLIPYVDIGLTLEPKRDSQEEFPPIEAISGNVFTFVPGGPCLWCSEFVTDAKLAKETQSRGRPYLRTIDKTDALVVSFNGVLASQAVNEVLLLLVGFAPADARSFYKKYDGFIGAISPCDVRRNTYCTKCSSFLGAGDPVWTESR